MSNVLYLVSSRKYTVYRYLSRCFDQFYTSNIKPLAGSSKQMLLLYIQENYSIKFISDMWESHIYSHGYYQLSSQRILKKTKDF